MGAPQTPIIPSEWDGKTTMKALPSTPGLEDDFAYWIEELSAWIAVDEEDADFIREVLPDAKILLPADLEKIKSDTER
jgi:hypothetical protein